MSKRSFFLASPLVVLVSVCAACSSGPPAPAYIGPPASATPTTLAPMEVEVDTGKTMSAAAGQGVGVFVEYTAGGSWNVYWTCDSQLTSSTCAYAVSITTQDGSAITSVATQGFAASDTVHPGASSIDAATVTDVGVPSVSFTTAPGTPIEVDAAVGGLKDGRLFFFVQQGAVNGGHAGTFTDPLLFRPVSP